MAINGLRVGSKWGKERPKLTKEQVAGEYEDNNGYNTSTRPCTALHVRF